MIYSLRLIFECANFIIQSSEYRNNISSEISQLYFEQSGIISIFVSPSTVVKRRSPSLLRGRLKDCANNSYRDSIYLKNNNYT